MLTRAVRLFAARPVPTLVLWVAVLSFGILSFTTLLPRAGFPAVDVPVTVVSGSYLADDPAVVDADVVRPALDAVSELDGVEHVDSFARANSFSLVVELGTDLTSEDGVDLLGAALDGAGLPADATLTLQPVDAARFANEFDVLVAVTGPPGTDAAAFDEVAGRLVDDLAGVADVERAEVLELVDTAADLDTGEAVVRQTTFNDYAVNAGEGLVFLPAVTVGVRAFDDTDQLDLSAGIDDALDDARAAGELGDGFDAAIAADFATQIESELSSLQQNTLTGVIAVTVVTFLLISWRASIVTAAFLVTVLAAVMGALWLLGISLNTISLFGVILALGLFVDDAVVITEAIDRFRRRGDSVLDTISTAIRRVGAASVSGTLTTVLVFTPLVFTSGILGDFIRQLPVTVIVGLLVSLVLSFVVIPTLSRYLVLSTDRSSGVLSRFESRLGDAAAGLPALLNHRRRLGLAVGASMIVLSIAAVAGSGVFAGRAGFDIFPLQDDADSLFVEIDFAPGTDLDRAADIAEGVQRTVVDELGDDVTGGFLYQGNERSAFLDLELVSFRDRATPAPELVDRLEPELAAIDGARVTVQQAAQGPPRDEFPFQVQVFGEDEGATRALAADLRDWLDGRALQTASGSEVRIVESIITLGDVVARDDGRRLLEVRARFDDDDQTANTAAAEEAVTEEFDADRLAGHGLGADALGFDLGFESDNEESFASLGVVFPIALLSMLVLLVAQFRSILQPLLIFLAIPFTFFGVFGGLLLTGNPISFFAVIGLIGLVGIAVNNTILLVDFANQERRDGADPVTAISSAVKLRFRPLVTTTLTTVAGLLPLALTDPFWEPLAFTIIFGLLSSTALVLLAFPYYYLLVEAIRSLLARLRGRIGRAVGRGPDGGEPARRNDPDPHPAPASV